MFIFWPHSAAQPVQLLLPDFPLGLVPVTYEAVIYTYINLKWVFYTFWTRTWSVIVHEKRESPTLMTVSKVTLTFMLLVALFGEEVCSRASGFSVLRLQQAVSQGRVFLNTLTMRIFTGNMMRELWTPIMNCCQVNSNWPRNKEREMDCILCTPLNVNMFLIVVLWIKVYSKVVKQSATEVWKLKAQKHLYKCYR